MRFGHFISPDMDIFGGEEIQNFIQYVFDKLGATRYGYLATPRKTGR